MTGLLLHVALFPLGTTHDCAIGQAGPSILSSALWALGRSLRADWGSFRVPIRPEAGTLVPGRDPSSFKLHGGRRPGSAGCIDVGGGIFGDSMTQRLLKDLRSDPDGRIPLIVR